MRNPVTYGPLSRPYIHCLAASSTRWRTRTARGNRVLGELEGAEKLIAACGHFSLVTPHVRMRKRNEQYRVGQARCWGAG